MRITPNRILQFVFMVVFQLAFGLTKAGIFSLITSGRAEKVRAYVSQIDKSFPGGSTTSKRMRQVFEACKRELMELAEGFQDSFYMTVGKWARSSFAKEFTHPKKLYLIDTWSSESYNKHEMNYVIKRFQKEIDTGRVYIIRGAS